MGKSRRCHEDDHAARRRQFVRWLPSVGVFCATAAVGASAAAQSATDSTTVAQRFAVAVAHDLVVVRTSSSSPASPSSSVGLLITPGDAPASFLATLHDSARSGVGAALSGIDATLRYHVIVRHFAITRHEASLDVVSWLGRSRDALHQQWSVVYFAARDPTGWRVRAGVTRELAQSKRPPEPDASLSCLAAR